MNRIIRNHGGAILLLLALVSAAMSGCGDPAPTDYIPEFVTQGFLIVGEPIRNIVISRSQAVTDTFNVAKGIISDATVQIANGDTTLNLVYRADSSSGGSYYYPDTTYLVRPHVTYSIRVALADGGVMTGHTTTPGQVTWIQAPRDSVTYPAADSLNAMQPDSLRLIWTPVDDLVEFPISVRCLDTLGYGKYLSPPTPDTNMRVGRKFDTQDPHYSDLTRWGFVQGTSTPISWFVFKWYGPQLVTVYAGDRNFVNWFKFTHFGRNVQYDPILGSIQGGAGVFASASTAEKQIFVRKGGK